MITAVDIKPESELELALAFLIDASPKALFRCWTEPALLPRWFAPRPLTTEVKRLDLRIGGVMEIAMHDPASGAAYPANGVYLEIAPDRKLVFTDAFTDNWVPAGQPFMAAEVSFTPKDGKTLYVARARHWNAETVKTHEEMGFHPGWTQCAHQLAELAATLK
jgi:uncharacterized protein YndB with AHSA1/START domain